MSAGLTVVTLPEGSERVALHSIDVNGVNRTIASFLSLMRA